MNDLPLLWSTFHGEHCPIDKSWAIFLKLFQQLPQLTKSSAKANSSNLFIGISLALFPPATNSRVGIRRPSNVVARVVACYCLLNATAIREKRVSSETYNRQTLEITQHPSGGYFSWSIIKPSLSPRSHIHFLCNKERKTWSGWDKKSILPRGSCITAS